jgi:hypothetical protein
MENSGEAATAETVEDVSMSVEGLQEQVNAIAYVTVAAYETLEQRVSALEAGAALLAEDPGAGREPGERLSPGAGREPGERLSPGAGREPGERLSPGAGREPGERLSPGAGRESSGSRVPEAPATEVPSAELADEIVVDTAGGKKRYRRI